MWNEFKQFALRGNAVDLAIGIIIGAAFGTIVASLVADIIMPPLSVVTGKVDFTNWFLTLSGGSYATLKAAKDAGAITVNYGLFINTIINFAVVAFAIFLIIKQVNRLKRTTPPPPGPPARQEVLLEEIRDLLARKA